MDTDWERGFDANQHELFEPEADYGSRFTGTAKDNLSRVVRRISVRA